MLLIENWPEVNMECNHLLKEIEDLRHELYILSKDKELVDPVVVRLSQELDLLLNLYGRLCSTDDYHRVCSGKVS